MFGQSIDDSIGETSLTSGWVEYRHAFANHCHLRRPPVEIKRFHNKASDILSLRKTIVTFGGGGYSKRACGLWRR